MAHNFIDIRLFDPQFLAGSGGKEQDAGFLVHAKASTVYMYLSHSKWLPVIALTGKAGFVTMGNTYRP